MRRVLSILYIVTLALFFSTPAQALPAITVTLTGDDPDQVYYHRASPAESDIISFTLSGLPEGAKAGIAFGKLDLDTNTFTAMEAVYGGEVLAGSWNGMAWTFSTPVLNTYNNDNSPIAVQVYSGGLPIRGAEFLLSRSGIPSPDDFVLVNLFTPDGPMVEPGFDTPGLNLKEINASNDLVFRVGERGSITFPANSLNPVNILAVDETYTPKISSLATCEQSSVPANNAHTWRTTKEEETVF